MARRVPVVENRSCTSSSTPSKTPRRTPSKGAAAGGAGNGAGTTPSSVVTPTTMVGGILHPPPGVRCVVDKTAEFVAQNGVEFEMKILSNEKRNPTFNFLKSKDAYHPYYQHRILEFLDQGPSPVKRATPNTNDVFSLETEEREGCAVSSAAASSVEKRLYSSAQC